jgi:hypothetical protein
MDITNVKCYFSAKGEDLIEQWAAQDETIRGDLVATVECIRPHSNWPDALCKPLEDRPGSQCAGLDEIILDGKFDSGKKYYCRILGFRGPQSSDFTMLYAFDKNKISQYGLPCREAQERKKHVERDWGRAGQCLFSRKE